jgi:hypothetical protein
LKRSVLTIPPFAADKELMWDGVNNALFVTGDDRAHS